MAKENASLRATGKFKFKRNYVNEKIFRFIYDSLHENVLNCSIQHQSVTELLPLFKFQNGLLLYKTETYVPHSSVMDILQIAHDCEISVISIVRKSFHNLKHFTERTNLKRLRPAVPVLISSNAVRIVEASLKIYLSLSEPRNDVEKAFLWTSLLNYWLLKQCLTALRYLLIAFLNVFIWLLERILMLLWIWKVFFDNIFWVHGLPDLIISD